MTDYFAPGGFADNIYTVRSKVITAPLAVGTYNLIQIPKFAFILDVWLETQVVCVPGTALATTVGFLGNGETADPDYFMVNADTATGSLGMARATQSATPFEGKRFMDASGAVTLTLGAGGNLTAGKMQAFMQYVILHG